MVKVVGDIVSLNLVASARVDAEKLGTLYRQLGEVAAEDVVCRATEDLAVRLSNCEQNWRDKDLVTLRKSMRGIVAVAEQVGMQTLACVARDVNAQLQQQDNVATAATFARLLRVGERSLCAVWDLQDLSV